MNVQEATAKALLVDRPALAAAQAAGDVLGANAVLMDAYNTDVRPLLADLRAGMGLDPDPMAAYAPLGLRASGSSAERVGGAAGGLGRMSIEPSRPDEPPVAALLDRSNRLGADPRNTNYAGGNTSAKGIGDRPGDRHAGRAAVGQGLRRRPRHADRGRPRRPAARPAARARRRLPGRRARGRDGRRVRLLPARPRRRGAVDRHGDARPRRRRPRRPPPPRLRDRVRDRRRRRGADPRAASATASRGSPGAGRASSSASTSPRSGATHPRGDRRDPRRPRDHGLGRDLRGVRGELARDHPDRRAVHRGARPARAVRAVDRRATSRCPTAERRDARGRAPAARPRPRLDGPAAGRPLHRQRRRPRLPRREAEHPRLAALGTSCPDHFLRTKVRPMVLDLPPTAPTRGRPSPGCASSTRRTATTTPPTTSATRRRTARAMRGADPAIVLVPGVGMFSLRREQADGAGRRRVLRQRDQRHARRRGAVDLRADRGVGEVPDRVLGARGGQARSGCPKPKPLADAGRVRDRRRVRDRQGDRPSGSRPRAPASSSPTSTPTSAEAVAARDRRHGRRDQRAPPTSPTRRRSPPRSATRSSRSAASTSSSTTPACRSRSRCSRRRSTTGTSSTTSWPAARSSSRARRRGS